MWVQTQCRPHRSSHFAPSTIQIARGTGTKHSFLAGTKALAKNGYGTSGRLVHSLLKLDVSPPVPSAPLLSCAAILPQSFVPANLILNPMVSRSRISFGLFHWLHSFSVPPLRCCNSVTHGGKKGYFILPTQEVMWLHPCVELAPCLEVSSR